MSLHDPTKKKKRQYCSAIFTCNNQQHELAKKCCSRRRKVEETVEKVENVGSENELETRIEVLRSWTEAENRHQKYYEKKAAKKKELKIFGSKSMN
jgi:peptide methionine sulfoxide reductase MsrA